MTVPRMFLKMYNIFCWNFASELYYSETLFCVMMQVKTNKRYAGSSNWTVKVLASKLLFLFSSRRFFSYFHGSLSMVLPGFVVPGHFSPYWLMKLANQNLLYRLYIYINDFQQLFLYLPLFGSDKKDYSNLR